MLNYVRYKVLLFKLHRQSILMDKELADFVKNNAPNTPEYCAELNHLGIRGIELEDWIKFVKTDYFQRKCDRLIIEMPEKNEVYYYKHNFDDYEGDRFILTTKGFELVRSSIRKEEKDLRDRISFWSSIFTGLIGASIGLITIIKMKF